MLFGNGTSKAVRCLLTSPAPNPPTPPTPTPTPTPPLQTYGCYVYGIDLSENAVFTALERAAAGEAHLKVGGAWMGFKRVWSGWVERECGG